MMTDFERVVEFLEGPGVRNWQFTSEGIKLVNIRNIVNDNLDLSTTSTYLSVNEVNKKYSHFLLKEGDYVMASSGVTWGKIAEVKKEHLPLCLNTSIIKLVAKKNLLNKRYLWHFIKTPNFRRQINRLITGSAQPNFGPSHLKKIQIPLPPLSEQQRIADLLDAADALRQKDKALLEKYEALGQSLFLELFGDPVSNPKGWEVKTIDEVSLLVTKGSSPNWQGFEYLDQGVRFVTSENVRLGFLDCKKGKFVAQEFHDMLNRSKLKENDLLVNLVGASIGRGALVTKSILPANINQAVAKIEFNNLINPSFALNQMITPQIQESLIGNKVEGARANISLQNVKDIKFIFPPLDLQNHFASQIELIEQQKAMVKENLEKSEALFQGLLGESFK